MTLPAENPPLSIGKQLLKQLSSDSTIDQSIKDNIQTYSGRLYTALKEENNDKIGEELAQFTNIFRTYTHSKSKYLTDIQKLKLAHVFIDISDDIKTIMVERLKQKQTEKPLPSFSNTSKEWSSWGAGLLSNAYKAAGYGVSLLYKIVEKKPLTEEELIQQIDQFQEAMNHPELEISLSKVKELLGLVLNAQGYSSAEKQIENMSIKELMQFLTNVHEEKQSQANTTLNSIPSASSLTYFDRAYELVTQSIEVIHQTMITAADDVQQKLIEYKNKKITESIQCLMPEEMFDGDLSTFIETLLDKSMSKKNLDSDPLKKLIVHLSKSYLNNLQNHLSRVFEEKNMMRLGICMNQKIAFILKAINTLPPDATQRQMLEALSFKDMNVEQYTAWIDERCSHHCAWLISKNIQRDPEHELINAKSLWKGIKNAFRTAINNVKQRLIATILEEDRLISNSSALKKSTPINKFGTAADLLGVGAQLQLYNQHASLISLFLIESILGEVKNIAAESQNNTQSSGFDTMEEAAKQYQESLNLIGETLSTFNKSEGSLVQRGLFSIVSFFGAAVVGGQTSGTLFDFTTPIISTLAPAWKKWLTPNHAKKA